VAKVFSPDIACDFYRLEVPRELFQKAPRLIPTDTVRSQKFAAFLAGRSSLPELAWVLFEILYFIVDTTGDYINNTIVTLSKIGMAMTSLPAIEAVILEPYKGTYIDLITKGSLAVPRAVAFRNWCRGLDTVVQATISPNSDNRIFRLHLDKRSSAIQLYLELKETLKPLLRYNVVVYWGTLRGGAYDGSQFLGFVVADQVTRDECQQLTQALAAETKRLWSQPACHQIGRETLIAFTFEARKPIELEQIRGLLTACRAIPCVELPFLGKPDPTLPQAVGYMRRTWAKQ